MDKGKHSNFNEDEEGVDRRLIMSSSVACAFMAWKFMIGGEPLERALASILDKVSAGMLAIPFTCLIDDVK